jgi:putative ABC transport system permease protein
MLKNYFKIAYRYFWKNRTTSFISISGLAIGMACCMLILIHVRDELSFNLFNSQHNHIYRINWLAKDNSQTAVYSASPVVLSKGIKEKIPAIERVVKLFPRSGQMQAGNTPNASASTTKRFQEQNVFFVDQDMFEIFTIPFIYGDKNSALIKPNSVVITDEMANKYFGTGNPVGKTLNYDNKVLLQITGVVKKMPDNSDIKFDFLVSFETLYQSVDKPFADFIKNDWSFNPCDTWVLLQPGASGASVEAALNQHLTQNGTDRSRQMNKVLLMPLNDLHLHAASVLGNVSSSDIAYIYVFIGIAFLILLIANVNFINLSIARAINRVKEIGMYKVLGAGKRQLVFQFLYETLLTSLIAFLLAIVLTQLSIPLLNRLTDKHFDWTAWGTPVNLAVFGLIFFAAGISAGLYPAFFITRFNTSLALKGKSGDQVKRNIIQKTLSVTQFTISIILIIGTVVIYRQMQYLHDKPLGFQKHQVVVVPIFGTGAFSYGNTIDTAVRHRMNIFYDDLNAYPKIKSVTATSEMPGQGLVRGLIIPQGYYEQNNVFAPWLSVDYNFLQTLDMKIVAGRNFSKATGHDNIDAFIINESAVRAFGWRTPENALGKAFVRGKQTDGKKGHIIGVVKDFDFNSLSNPMEPLVMDVNVPRFTEFAINIQPDHVNETIQKIKQTWDKIFPQRVFEYSFLDKTIDGQYRDKENFSHMISCFALAAMLLSCSGLFSLAFFLAVKRTKEIGIRKVLGANISSIMVLLSTDFIKMVLLSALIASPLAWWLVHQWLQGFAYRVSVEWWIFALATIMAILVAFITISFQSVKAALVNPVKSLRSE